MNIGFYIFCIIVCILQIADHNRIKSNLKNLFEDGYIPSDYDISSAGEILILFASIFFTIGYIIQSFTK